MKSNIISLFLIIVFLSSCTIFQSDSFPGKWKFTFGGDLQRVIDFVVAENNSFEFDIDITLQGRTYPIVYKGKIAPDGMVAGEIYFETEQVGTLSGKCDYEKGEGIWQGGEFSGTWSAVKQ